MVRADMGCLPALQRLFLLPLLLVLTGIPQAYSQKPDDPPDDPLANLSGVARNLLLLVSLLAFTLVVNNFVQKRGVPIPEALVTVAIGIVAGAVVTMVPSFQSNTISELEDESAREFMVAFIAPIIFAEGYGLKSREFFENLTRILTHAFIGTLLSSIVVAVGIFYLLPLADTRASMNFSFAECLTFGALISSTDPVTTLAIFKDQQMVENGLSYLYYTVLGESILNDAVAITLFQSFGNLVVTDQSIDASAVVSITWTFLVTFVGSLGIGVACGLGTALLLKFARLGAGASEEEHFYFNVPEIGVALVLAYLPFLIAEAVGLSGIVAVMFAGITMRHYAHYNMTQVTRQVFLPTIELIATLSETYVFLLLGLGVFLLRNNYSASLILLAIALCLIGRAMHVYPFSWVINRCSSAHRLNRAEQHVVCFAGLRGAIAFMCALSFPQNAKTKAAEHRGVFLCTTVIIVGATLVFLGWPTTKVLDLLDIRSREDSRVEHNNEVEDGQPRQEEETSSERPSSWCTSMKSAYEKRTSDVSQHVKRILMTSDAVVQREYNSQLASAIKSQRAGSTFFRQPSPRPSGAVNGEAAVPVAGSAANGSVATAGRDSMPAGTYTFGLHPHLGMPAAPGFGRPSMPGAYGRPSAPLTSNQEQAAPLVTGRPSAPPRLQGSGASNGPHRSGRMLCNP